jgi:hypothetical protein
MVILGPAPAPDDVQSCSLAANRTAMALYTIATSLEGEAATIGLPASDVSRIAMFRGTCRRATEACSNDLEKSDIALLCCILWDYLIITCASIEKIHNTWRKLEVEIVEYLSKKLHVHLLRCCLSTAMTKNITPLTTLRALKEAHVLNQSQDLQHLFLVKHYILALLVNYSIECEAQPAVSRQLWQEREME